MTDEFHIEEINPDEIPSGMGREYWDVSDFIENECYEEKYYNGAERLIPAEIRDEIKSIDFSKIRKDNRTNSNADIRSILLPKNWKKGQDVGEFKGSELDFFKNKVGMEVQFRQATNLIHDVLKLQKGYSKGKLVAGIIITFDEKVGIYNQAGQDSSFQNLDRWIREFRDVITFEIPLWSIGIKP